MIKHGIKGPATCAEIFKPYYGANNMAVMEGLEKAITGNKGISEIGQALGNYFATSNSGGPYLEFAQAPSEVQNLDLCMRDAAEALIRKAGGNPDDFDSPPIMPISASERY